MEKMIKVLVINNSLGNLGPIFTAIDREKPDMIFHLGGGARDLGELGFEGKLYAVRSGSEFPKRLPTVSKIGFSDEIILLTHGDGLSLKNREKLVNFAYAQGATIVLLGCDDEPAYFEQNGVKFVCPGSIHDRMSATYTILTLSENAEMQIEHHRLIEE